MNLHITTMGEDERFVLAGSEEELRTIWFALKEYKDILLEHATKGFPTDEEPERTPPTIEDEAFLDTTAGEVARAMYDIKESHGTYTPEMVVRVTY